MSRLFTTLFDTATPVAPAAGAPRFVPAIDIVETEQEYILRADLPGLTEQDVKLEALNGTLTISGERHRAADESRQGYRRIERATGSFARALKLPEGVDATTVTAGFEHGVLEVHVPKPEASKPQAIEIAVGSGGQAAVTA